MKNLLLTLCLLIGATGVFAQLSQEVSGDFSPASTSRLPVGTGESSAMNDAHPNLYISKFCENMLKEGETMMLIVSYQAPANLPDLSGIGSMEGASRSALLNQYQAAMDVAAQPVMAEINGIPNTETMNAAKYSAHILVNTDMAGLMSLITSDKVLIITENAMSLPSTDVTNVVVGADIVKAAGKDGSGTSIAILDTGLDPNHEIFAGKVVASVCTSTSFAPFGISSTCPGGVDDISMFGGVDVESLTDGSAGAPCPVPAGFLVTRGDDPSCGRHGNNVAGIAAGLPVGSTEGIASGANLIGINVFSYWPSEGGLVSFGFDQLSALEWVFEHAATYNIAAANMSLGGGGTGTPCDDDPLAPIITMLRDAGVATVIASGNNGFIDGVSFPACISAAIAVGATDNADNLAGFSNHDEDLVDLLAPGVSVFSAYGYQPDNGTNWYYAPSGTSMAAPHVAGAFAILKGAYPNATVDQLENALKVTGVTVADPLTGDVVPRIQIDAALEYLDNNIPTVSQWGLCILGLMLTSLAVVRIRRSVLA